MPGRSCTRAADVCHRSSCSGRDADALARFRRLLNQLAGCSSSFEVPSGPDPRQMSLRRRSAGRDRFQLVERSKAGSPCCERFSECSTWNTSPGVKRRAAYDHSDTQSAEREYVTRINLLGQLTKMASRSSPSPIRRAASAKPPPPSTWPPRSRWPSSACCSSTSIPQGNLTSGVGLKGQAAPGGTIYEALMTAGRPTTPPHFVLATGDRRPLR